jgi:hypothetical protein
MECWNAGLGDCTPEALSAQSWKIDHAKTPRTQRKISSFLSNLAAFAPFARDIPSFGCGVAALCLCSEDIFTGNPELGETGNRVLE